MRSRSKQDRLFSSDRVPVFKPSSSRISFLHQDILLPSYRSPGKTGRSFLFCMSSHIGAFSKSQVSDIILLFSHRYLTFPQILDTKR
ncbi:hypothetical protein CH367_13800 [Leptospira barantonii]|uniref:Uncharacterized protein n=1 Tax=Leptospira barantonii TaxID=2023184 RepID=A0ABX4NIA9_9LEPT|nr:hypothetical protein CH367_13800 [Leptospira barantonii]